MVIVTGNKRKRYNNVKIIVRNREFKCVTPFAVLAHPKADIVIAVINAAPPFGCTQEEASNVCVCIQVSGPRTRKDLQEYHRSHGCPFGPFYAGYGAWTRISRYGFYVSGRRVSKVKPEMEYKRDFVDESVIEGAIRDIASRSTANICIIDESHGKRFSAINGVYEEISLEYLNKRT
jgi:hypothetical protein